MNSLFSITTQDIAGNISQAAQGLEEVTDTMADDIASAIKQ
jgi:hypothetical protein